MTVSSRLRLLAKGRPRTSRLLRRVAHRLVQAADGILNLADGLVGLAVTLQLGVADSLANSHFRGAFDFLNRTGDSVLIHDWALLAYCEDAWRRLSESTHRRSWS